MAEADPCRRALTPTEEANLFAGDALRAARKVMSGNPAGAEGEAYLAVYVVLAAAALGQDRAKGEKSVGLSDALS
ncbi:hypothetical protein LOK46_14425 [Methylobacterium sp. NMS14P]|uniref:hypothetical protein n=1 Tax=Methylobacterium sp. NMS14P TaxID=2894310 RepID=UPI00235951E3|nr:hypothetical protein [Methylobacterium sp. NMS14P]WCS27968.1 hypothetical protein LOK46_14425 [Methylobacterium sp. NMS14P]